MTVANDEGGYNLGKAHGKVNVEVAGTKQYMAALSNFLGWQPTKAHFWTTLAVSMVSLGFSIAAFSMALVVYLAH